MNRITLFVTIAVGLTALPIPAFSQAESALINATSSLSTVNASSSLNRALNQSSGQLAGRIQQIAPTSAQRLTQRRGQKVVLKSQVSTTGVRAVSPGPMIVSVQAGEARCATGSAAGQGKNDKSGAEAPNARCGGADAFSKAKLQESYKSATLPSISK